MAAKLIFRGKHEFDDGAIMEMVIWQLPRPVPPAVHPLKYRLFYGYPGRRLVGYDNERGKGDHRHVGGREYSYRFTSVEQLVNDFLADIESTRGTL